MTTEKQKDLNYYLNLAWTYKIEQEYDSDEGRVYIARVREWPRVVTDAPTIEQVLEDIKEVLKSVIKLYLGKEEEIPEPQLEKLYKGNIAYRTTPERHFLLAREAAKRHLSLSQLIDSSLDRDLRSVKKN